MLFGCGGDGLSRIDGRETRGRKRFVAAFESTEAHLLHSAVNLPNVSKDIKVIVLVVLATLSHVGIQLKRNSNSKLLKLSSDQNVGSHAALSPSLFASIRAI